MHGAEAGADSLAHGDGKAPFPVESPWHNSDAILSRGPPATREARKLKHCWFVDITSGDKSVYDLLEAGCAADGSGRPLHRSKIHRVLAAQPGCSTREARAILRKVVSLLDKPTEK
jgi:hypothetical protein